MRKPDLFWMTNPAWYHYDENLRMIINDNAPQEAKDSFYNYISQSEDEDAAG